MDKKRIARRAKTALTTVIALILTGELLARFALGLGSPPLVVEHPTIEYLFRPNQDVSRFHNRQFYNQYGMRSDDFPQMKSEGEFRVLVIGDSVINGGSLTDHNELATTIAQHKLERNPRFDTVTVGNISAGSWGPANQLAYLEEFGCFDADRIVFVLSSHDYNDVPTFAPLNPNTHPTSAPLSALYEGIDRYLLGSAPWRSHNVQITDTTQPNARIYEDHCHNLLSTAISSDAGVTVIQYLNRREINTGKTEDGYSQIHRICENLGIPTFSNEAFFSAAIKKQEQPFRDNIHPNAFGQTLLAQLILDSLQIDEKSTRRTAPAN